MDSMMMPKTPEEFIKDYSFVDDKKVYTNGSELISVFRVKQMLEHYFATDNNVDGKWIPVTERLPEPTENPVLVPYAGSVWTAWRHADYWELGGVLNTVCVTHWMPMPLPVKEA